MDLLTYKFIRNLSRDGNRVVSVGMGSKKSPDRCHLDVCSIPRLCEEALSAGHDLHITGDVKYLDNQIQTASLDLLATEPVNSVEKLKSSPQFKTSIIYPIINFNMYSWALAAYAVA